MDSVNTGDCPSGLVQAAPSLHQKELHVILWILASCSIVGNALILLWRFSKPRVDRHSVGSLLIISLAAAYILYGCHEVLLEISLLCPVFHTCGTSINSTSCELCESSYWISTCSSMVASWTTLGIAVLSLTFTVPKFNVSEIHRVLAWVFLIGDIVVVCLVTLPAMTSKFYDYGIVNTCCQSQKQLMTDDVQVTTLIVTQCTSSTATNVPTSIPAVVAFTNTILTALCTFILIITCRRVSAPLNSSHSHTGISTVPRDCQVFQSRFVVLVLLSLLCWWPVFILHILYVFETRESSSDLATVNLVAMAIPPALHPIIYILPRKILAFVKGLGSCRCHVTGYIQNYELMSDDQRQCGHCCCCTCTQQVVKAQNF